MFLEWHLPISASLRTLWKVSCQKDLDRNFLRRSASAAEFGDVEGIDRASYCCGTDLLVPCINACISSCVSRPSLLLSIALKIRS